MGQFTLIPTPLDRVDLIQPRMYGDQRGYFMETFNQRDFEAAGIPVSFVQDNQSKSARGVLRGLHFQVNRPQGKLVRVISGEVFDVAVDLRRKSPSFGKWHGVVLSSENNLQIYVPPGLAHGFLVLSESAELTYKCTDFYDPDDECGIIWDDPEIGIEWPLDGIGDIILSEKDQGLKSMQETGVFF